MSLPKLDGVTTIRALSSIVLIKYDSNGIPYIKAKNLEDMFLAQGYVTACDRMFQMDILRRLACGRLSQILGPVTIPSDKLSVALNFQNRARQEYDNLSYNNKIYLDAFANGINAYLANNFDKLPFEFKFLNYHPQPWTGIDSIAIMEYLNYRANDNFEYFKLQNQITNKLPSALCQDLFDNSQKNNSRQNNDFNKVLNSKIIPEIYNIIEPNPNFNQPATLFGSHAFAIAGKSSSSHGSLLACSKHDSFTNPSLWYLCSLISTDTKLVGATYPGIPGIVIGRNNELAFSEVDLKINNQKLILEKFSTNLSNYYLSPKGYLKSQIINTKIPVRFYKDIDYPIEITRNGPIISRQKDVGVVLYWPNYFRQSHSMETNLNLNLAKTLSSATQALNNYLGSPRQYLIAQSNNQILSLLVGYFTKANLEPSNIMGNCIEGDKLNYSYQDGNGQSPLKIPVIQNDEYLVSLLNMPVKVINNLNQGYAIQVLIQNNINQGRLFSLPILNEIESSAYNLLSLKIMKQIKTIIKEANYSDKYLNDSLNISNSFDGNISGDSAAACIYETFMQTMLNNMLTPKLGSNLTLKYQELYPSWTSSIAKIIQNNDAKWLPTGETSFKMCILTTYLDTLAKLRIKYGDLNKLNWQNNHKVTFQYFLKKLILKDANFNLPFLDFGPFPIGFDNDSVKMVNVEPQKNKALYYKGNCGSVFNLMIDMANSNEIYYNLTPGQSGQLMSNYYNNGINNWLSSKPNIIYFSETELVEHVSHKLLLSNR